MRNAFIFRVMIPAVVAFGVGSAVANADTIKQPETAPKVSSMPVSHSELRHFAAAIKQIQPIDMKAHQVIANNKLNATEKHQKLQSYDKQITAVLAQHHLTPVRYETLLKRAESDPSFAKRTEEDLHKIG